MEGRYISTAQSFRCLLQLAEECADMSIANIIKNDFYYDDLSTGASTEDELLKIYNSVIEILSSASFPLRKTRTNCPKIFENDVNNNTLNLTKQSCILGLNWSPTLDLFTFPIDINTDSLNITKRIIISTTCKIFTRPFSCLMCMYHYCQNNVTTIMES